MSAANRSSAHQRMRTGASCAPISTLWFSRIVCSTKPTSLPCPTMDLGRKSSNLTDTRKVTQARKNTLIVAVVLGLLGAWQLYRAHQTAAYVFWGSGGVLLVCAAIPVAAVA